MYSFYFWAFLVARIAGELAVIAGVSRTGFCFKILSPAVLSAVPEDCFFHLSLLWHLTEGRNLMLPLMLLWGLAGSWETDGPTTLPRWRKLAALPEKMYLMHCWEQVGGLLSALYPESPSPASGGRAEIEESRGLKYTTQVQNEWKKQYKMNFLITAMEKKKCSSW